MDFLFSKDSISHLLIKGKTFEKKLTQFTKVSRVAWQALALEAEVLADSNFILLQVDAFCFVLAEFARASKLFLLA